MGSGVTFTCTWSRRRMVPLMLMPSNPKSLPTPSPLITRMHTLAFVCPAPEVHVWLTVAQPALKAGRFTSGPTDVPSTYHCNRAGWALESVRAW